MCSTNRLIHVVLKNLRYFFSAILLLNNEYKYWQVAILDKKKFIPTHDLDRMVVGFTTTYAISTYHHWNCEFESHSGEVYSIQHYVIKFFSDLRQIGGFLKHFFSILCLWRNAKYSQTCIILWRSVLLVEDTRMTGENHLSVASHWKTLSHSVVSSTPRLSGIHEFFFIQDCYLSIFCIHYLTVKLQKKNILNFLKLHV
jgi:hypothetical protein